MGEADGFPLFRDDRLASPSPPPRRFPGVRGTPNQDRQTPHPHKEPAMTFRTYLQSLRDSLTGSRNGRRSKANRPQPRLEGLEDRMLLTSFVFSSDFRTLAIEGDP